MAVFGGIEKAEYLVLRFGLGEKKTRSSRFLKSHVRRIIEKQGIIS